MYMAALRLWRLHTYFYVTGAEPQDRSRLLVRPPKLRSKYIGCVTMGQTLYNIHQVVMELNVRAGGRLVRAPRRRKLQIWGWRARKHSGGMHQLAGSHASIVVPDRRLLILLCQNVVVS